MAKYKYRIKHGKFYGTDAVTGASVRLVAGDQVIMDEGVAEGPYRDMMEKILVEPLQVEIATAPKPMKQVEEEVRRKIESEAKAKEEVEARKPKPASTTPEAKSEVKAKVEAKPEAKGKAEAKTEVKS